MEQKTRYSKIVRKIGAARGQNCGDVYSCDKGNLRNFPCPKCGGEGEPYKATIYVSCRVCGGEIPWSLDFTRPFGCQFTEMDKNVIWHAWRRHREDFPQDIKNFRQVWRWVRAESR